MRGSGSSLLSEFRESELIEQPVSRQRGKSPILHGDSQQSPIELANVKAVEPFRLLLFHEIPSWQQENEFVLSCYRPTSGSILKSLESLFYIHNETVSIYSHLLGAILFASLPYFFADQLNYSYTLADSVDFAVFSIYALGVAICFVLSSTCHIVCNCTPAWAFYGNQLDYLGIILLMWSASIPTIYYGFYQDTYLQRLYWSLMSTAALTCGVVTMNRRFSVPRFRPCRAATYAALGITALVFVIHGVALHGWEAQNRRMSLPWMMWMAALNLTGAGLYIARIPERWFPYTFDLCGASHQLFHILVVFAALVHFAGLLHAMQAVKVDS